MTEQGRQPIIAGVDGSGLPAAALLGSPAEEARKVLRDEGQ
jgi:hypothetical protein